MYKSTRHEEIIWLTLYKDQVTITILNAILGGYVLSFDRVLFFSSYIKSRNVLQNSAGICEKHGRSSCFVMVRPKWMSL
jgi:hypothetical protein